ncbi:MAG: FAD-binding oxidoreductase [Halobacteriovoraceae bacterium]|nr:FAD-binding oxidoreductase [Halobacteriovoraceae bacterium]
MKSLRVQSLEALVKHIQSATPTLYHSSKTSTVIPYDQLESKLDPKVSFCDLTGLPKKIEFNSENNSLLIEGPVTWKEAKEFLQTYSRQIMTSPTEELACILAGVATSCTGERCFGFGPLRDQILSLKYVDHQGNLCKLSASKNFPLKEPCFQSYDLEYQKYKYFKNAPYPRLERETDLLTGTEGQLGVIVQAEIQTAPEEALSFFFLELPCWEEDFEPHFEIYQKVQNLRDQIYAVELIDSNSLEYLKPEERPVSSKKDLVFIEVSSKHLDNIYSSFLAELEKIPQENIYEISRKKYMELRANVPRRIFEQNSKLGVIKKGTDVQAPGFEFKQLIEYYRKASRLGISYNLFGHFGDAHLHFNFMPTNPEEVQTCDQFLEQFYKEMAKLCVSPFAEHGIGFLKQKFIQKFYTSSQKQCFQRLKEVYDPQGIFFPQGFMTTGPGK